MRMCLILCAINSGSVSVCPVNVNLSVVGVLCDEGLCTYLQSEFRLMFT